VRSPSPKERHDSLSRTADGDLLSKAVEALRCQVTNTTKMLHAEQGPDSSRAFLSTVTALISPASALAFIVLRPPSTPTPLLPAAQGMGLL
jgi:hypothetical protein